MKLLEKIKSLFGGSLDQEALSVSEQNIGEEKELKEGENYCPYCKSKKFAKMA